MVLMSFSEENHVPKLKSGEKNQTTRLQRKNPVKVGQTLQCYYRGREKKSCNNCLKRDACTQVDYVDGKGCESHNNFFGLATVKAVIPIKQALATMGKEEFARKDGFESWEKADWWFARNSGAGRNWTRLPYVVIHFEPHWLKEGGAQ